MALTKQNITISLSNKQAFPVFVKIFNYTNFCYTCKKKYLNGCTGYLTVNKTNKCNLSNTHERVLKLQQTVQRFL